MAEKELYDYLTTVTPDYSGTLAVAPQEVLTEVAAKKQEVHYFDDGADRVVALSDDPIFYIRLRWSKGISKADAGTIMDFYLDSSKANAQAKSFKWDHIDGHTYVVKFRSSLQRDWFESSGHRVQEVVLKVVGRIAD